MFNSTTLEVAIGMALIYLLISLFCTAINEVIAGILSSRAKNLERGIKSLFTEGNLSNVLTLTDAIYRHGLVQSLYRSGGGTAHLAEDIQRPPSYIPSRTFASALYDILFPNALDAVAAPGAVVPGPEAAHAARLNTMLTAIEALPQGPGMQAIRTLVKEAAGDADKTRQAFARWYDDGMDRAAGWYKKRTQRTLFIIGLLGAGLLNVDSIRVARALWTTPALRAYSVSAAENYARDHHIAPADHASNAEAPPDASNALAQLQTLNLPIGWNSQSAFWWQKSLRDQWFWWFLGLSVFGWLLTAVAVTLGAPFWFDTLNQFMVVRSTIKPREKSDVEGSKDPKKK